MVKDQRAYGKFRRASLILAMLAYSGAAPLPESSVIVIANPTVKLREISLDDLKAVYFGIKTSLSDGSRLKPVLEKGGATHSTFLKQYLGKSDFALQTYYRSLVFSGEGSIPAMVHSYADVVAYVAKTRDAIGYIAPSALNGSVRTLRVR